MSRRKASRCKTLRLVQDRDVSLRVAGLFIDGLSGRVILCVLAEDEGDYAEFVAALGRVLARRIDLRCFAWAIVVTANCRAEWVAADELNAAHRTFRAIRECRQRGPRRNTSSWPKTAPMATAAEPSVVSTKSRNSTRTTPDLCPDRPRQPAPSKWSKVAWCL